MASKRYEDGLEDALKQIVTPRAWNSRGEAVDFTQRPRIAVWRGIPGERASVKVVYRGQNRIQARWIRSEKPDESRVVPPCDRYDLCGGCPLMHLDATGQADARWEIVRGQLDLVGLQDVPVEGLVPSPDGLTEYRTSLRLVVGHSDHGAVRIGAPGRGTRRPIPIPQCLVVSEDLRRLMRTLAGRVIDLEIWPYDEGRGLLRYVVARQSRATGEILLTLVAGQKDRILNQLADELTQRIDQLVGVHLHLNDEPGNSFFDRDEMGEVRTRNLLGQDTIVDRLAGVEFRIGPGDFFQTNPAMADRLMRDVITLVEPEEGLPIIDAYSGVGGFALALAQHTGWSLGIEELGGAVRRARNSASAQRIPAEFLHAPVAQALGDLGRRLTGRRPVVIADPARRGLEPGVVQAIHELNPERVILVSCNPAALARDLAEFRELGWQIERVRPYDMFPNTPHVELVTRLRPPDGGARGPLGRGPRRRKVRR
jgi:23S rRNA (uracil1939-C5)-methyltransferase